MRRDKPPLTALWHALDEATFGAERTLNLRESLPSVAEARLRVDRWLRERQVASSSEVLLITGRGNQSTGGIGMIRQAVLAMLPSLRRRGVVESWREHSPGSIVVKLAPMSALMSAPRRKRDTAAAAPSTKPAALEGLQPETIQLLHDLAVQNLEALGVGASEEFVVKEMLTAFSTLMSAIPSGADREGALREALRRAISEAND